MWLCKIKTVVNYQFLAFPTIKSVVLSDGVNGFMSELNVRVILAIVRGGLSCETLCRWCVALMSLWRMHTFIWNGESRKSWVLSLGPKASPCCHVEAARPSSVGVNHHSVFSGVLFLIKVVIVTWMRLISSDAPLVLLAHRASRGVTYPRLSGHWGMGASVAIRPSHLTGFPGVPGWWWSTWWWWGEVSPSPPVADRRPALLVIVASHIEDVWSVIITFQQTTLIDVLLSQKRFFLMTDNSYILV